MLITSMVQNGTITTGSGISKDSVEDPVTEESTGTGTLITTHVLYSVEY